MSTAVRGNTHVEAHCPIGTASLTRVVATELTPNRKDMHVFAPPRRMLTTHKGHTVLRVDGSGRCVVKWVTRETSGQTR